MIISFFSSQKSNTPDARELSWDELVAELANVRTASCTLETCRRNECVHKSGPAYSPARWPEGATREKASVLDVALLVLDLDHVSVDEVSSVPLVLEGIRHLLHSSHSDQIMSIPVDPDAMVARDLALENGTAIEVDRCVRVVVDLTRPVTAEEWPAFYAAAIALTELSVDRATKDASRLYYQPSRPMDADYFFDARDGVPLDVDALLASAPAQAATRAVTDARARVAVGTSRMPTDRAAVDRAVDALVAAWPTVGGGVHRTGLALLGALAMAGWDQEDAAQFIAAVCEQAQPGNAKLDKRRKDARDTWRKVEDGSDVTGWPTLASIIGDAAVTAARDALGLNRAPEGDPEMTAWLAARQAATPGPDLGDVRAQVRAWRRSAANSSSAERIRDADLVGRATGNRPLTDEIGTESGPLLGRALVAILRAAPAATDEQVAALVAESTVGQIVEGGPLTFDRLAAYVGQARAVARQASAPRAQADVDSLPDPSNDEEVRARLMPSPLGEGNRATGPNIDLVLRFSEELRGRLRFNELTKDVVVTEGRFRNEFANTLDVAIKNWLETHWQIPASTQLVGEQMLRVARVHGSWNPVKEYLEALEWDGVDRIHSWLRDYCHCPEQCDRPGCKYVEWIASKFLLGCVARAYDPGCKLDTVLVMEGVQGAKKSSCFQVLGAPWFSDTPIVMGDKDSRMLASSAWIIELAELASLSRSEREQQKAFLSSAWDTFRPPYGRAVERWPRRSAFAGTTNMSEWLDDVTGNRRWWPVLVGNDIDTDGLKAVRDQLWAEARTRYLAGEEHWLSRDQDAIADHHRMRREIEDPWIGIVREWATRTRGSKNRKAAYSMAEIAQSALSLNMGDLPRVARHLTTVLRFAGLTQLAPRSQMWRLGETARPEVEIAAPN